MRMASKSLQKPFTLGLVVAAAILAACAAVPPAAAAAAAPPLPKKYCVVNAALRPGGWARLGGAVTMPLAADVSSTRDGAITGSMSVVFPTDKCPPADKLAAALPGAFLAEPSEGGGSLVVDRVDASVGLDGQELGTASIAGFRGQVFSRALAGPKGDAPFRLKITGGDAKVASDIVAVAPVELTTIKPLPGRGCVLKAKGGDVVVDCSDVKLTGSLETKEGLAADLELIGSFVAEGALSRARLVDATKLPAVPPAVAPPEPAKPEKVQAVAAPGAEEDEEGSADLGGEGDGDGEGLSLDSLGGGGDDAADDGSGLEDPSALMDAGAVKAAAVEDKAGAAAGAATKKAAAAAEEKTAAKPAHAKQARKSSGPGPRCKHGAGPSCECEDGWAGDSCVRCTSASVCGALTGQLMSTCDTTMAYTTRTAYKAYTCSVKGGLGSLVKSITGVCNVRGVKLDFADGPLGMEPGAMLSAADAGAGAAVNGAAASSGAFCKLRVTLVQDANNPLSCVGRACTFGEGQSGFSCATAACTCAKGACMPMVQAIVDKVNNGSVGIECHASGDCTLMGLQPRLDLSCAAGECTRPDLAPKALPTLGGAPAKPFPTVAVTSVAVPLALAALGALGLGYVALCGRMFRSGSKRPLAAAGSGNGGGSLASSSASSFDCDDATKRAGGRALAAGRRSGGGGSGRVRLLPAEAAGLPVRFEFEGVNCTVPDRGGDAAAAADPAASFSGPSAGGGDAAAPDSPMAAAPHEPPPAPGRKVLLRGVSGVVPEGEVVGVMGPSGAGKSTLLSILSGATESVGAGARIEGSVSLGGEYRRSALRKVTAFVPQKDVLLPALSVEECVRYSALLRLPRDLSAAEIQDRIDSVLSELGLSHVATSLVGGSASIRGVSGGERRRVTIAMALVTRPRLVIMDEPTSGLDSFTAYNLMRTAHDIAAAGRVIIMSLHQPSPDMFESLSQVLLLAKGRLAYLGAPSNVGPHFAGAGFPSPPGRQPAEHMLHVASAPAGLAALLRAVPPGGFRGGSCGTPRKGGGGGDGWRQPEVATKPAADATAAAAAAIDGGSGMVMPKLAPIVTARRPEPLRLHCVASAGPLTPTTAAANGLPPLTPTAPRGVRGLLAAPREWLAGAARECAVLYWRAFTNMRREPRLLMLHALVALALGLVVGAVFFRLDGSNVGLQNRLGSMFFALALFGWTSVSVVDGLVLERELVEREVAGHYYRGSTYLLASLVLDGLLLRTAPALLFCGLMYPMVGLLPEATRVATFMFVLATYTCTVGALTTALTALCRSASATTLAMNIILLMWVLIGGYLVNPASIPVWLRWVRCLSPMSFAFEVLAANEIGDQYFSIHVDGFPEIGGVKGDVFLRTLGLNPSRTLQSAAALAAFYVGSAALAFAATSYSLWRHSGGSWARLLTCRGGDAAAVVVEGRGAGGGVGGGIGRAGGLRGASRLAPPSPAALRVAAAPAPPAPAPAPVPAEPMSPAARSAGMAPRSRAVVQERPAGAAASPAAPATLDSCDD